MERKYMERTREYPLGSCKIRYFFCIGKNYTKSTGLFYDEHDCS